MTRKTLIATAALLGNLFAAGAVLAAEPASYPRAIGSGENVEIEYGPNPGNVVGGGVVSLRQVGEETTAIYSAPPQRAVQAPVLRGSSENRS